MSMHTNQNIKFCDNFTSCCDTGLQIKIHKFKVILTVTEKWKICVYVHEINILHTVTIL